MFEPLKVYCIILVAGNYKEVLLKLIDADVLPKCYGGNRTDPDGNPRCTTVVTMPKNLLTLGWYALSCQSVLFQDNYQNSRYCCSTFIYLLG